MIRITNGVVIGVLIVATSTAVVASEESDKAALISESALQEESSVLATESGDPSRFQSPCLPLPINRTPTDGNPNNDDGWILVDFCTAGATGSGPAQSPECHRNDDDSAFLDLPFFFSFYGEPWDDVYINNNGNLSFGQLYPDFTSTPFPIDNYPMLAPFWADIDTGDQYDTIPMGNVWYKFVDEHTLAVTWDNVAYFSEQYDKLNTFQVLISDGSNPSLGENNNTCYCYDDMQWTTGQASGGVGGFDGTPATVGANRGDGVDFFQIGRFDHAGTDYDGPGGTVDGVDYLDGHGTGSAAAFCFSASGTNAPPVAVDFPADNTVFLLPGETLNLSLRFLSPEIAQSTIVTFEDPDSAQDAGLVLATTPGNTAVIDLNWTPDNDDVGAYIISFTATDDFALPGVTETDLAIVIGCADLPAVECTQEKPCDILEEEDWCSPETPIDTDVVSTEPENSVFCGGDEILVSHSRRGTVTESSDSTGDVCNADCHSDCVGNCVEVPLQGCYRECVLRCTNGVCIQWEDRCDIVTLQEVCNRSCTVDCDLNFDEVTQTSFFERVCGAEIQDIFEVRHALGTCAGEVIETHAVTGYGTATLSIRAPLQPGDYELCLAGDVVKSFSVDDCGAACGISIGQNSWSLVRGQSSSMPASIQTFGSGGTYELSLEHFEDDEHLFSLPLPAFLSVPATVAVPSDSIAQFFLSAVDAQPMGDQTHWANVILRAEGPTVCEIPIDITIVIPPNSLPTANAGADGPPVECLANHQAQVTLDGSSSFDSDSTAQTNDDIILFEWFEGFGQPTERLLGTGEILQAWLSTGSHSITLRVTDSFGETATDDVVVVVQDTIPPQISLEMAPSNLWPPNHRMIDVTATMVVSDSCGATSFTLLSVTSNEADNGIGDGNTVNDIQLGDIGTPDLDLRLRSERSGGGNGRLYEATYEATDDAGNTAVASGLISVPHAQGGSEPVVISVSETGMGTILEWTETAGALYYNVIRGTIANMVETDAAYLLESTTCIKSQSQDLSTVGSEDNEVPPTNEAFFYLVEYFDGWQASGVGTESAPKARLLTSPSCSE